MGMVIDVEAAEQYELTTIIHVRNFRAAESSTYVLNTLST